MFFPFLALLFGKGFTHGEGMKYSSVAEYNFSSETHLFGERFSCSVGVGGGGGEIFGGIISDISLHFVPRPLASAKFKITPFFTVDGETGTLKQGFCCISQFLDNFVILRF